MNCQYRLRPPFGAQHVYWKKRGEAAAHEHVCVLSVCCLCGKAACPALRRAIDGGVLGFNTHVRWHIPLQKACINSSSAPVMSLWMATHCTHKKRRSSEETAAESKRKQETTATVWWTQQSCPDFLMWCIYLSWGVFCCFEICWFFFFFFLRWVENLQGDSESGGKKRFLDMSTCELIRNYIDNCVYFINFNKRQKLFLQIRLPQDSKPQYGSDVVFT